MSIKIDEITQKAVDPESIQKPIAWTVLFFVAVAAFFITLKVMM